MENRYLLSKTLFSLLFSLFFIFTGCSVEEHFSHEEADQLLSATIVEEKNGTRTTLSDDPTNRKVDVLWQHGDAIGVFGSASGTNVRFQTEEGAISSDGKSTVFETSETAPEGELTGYYPYQQGAALLSGGVLQLTMPATQSYDTNQTGVVRPDPAVNMMVGKGKDGNIAFRNLFAILRITIAGSDGESVKQVVFTDLSGKPVSGKFSVNWNDDLPEAVFPETGSNNDQRIILDCGDGISLLDQTLTKFYLIVPARNYSKGFQVEFILADGRKIVKTIGIAGGKNLQRNMLYPIGDLFPSQEDKISYKMHPKASVISEERYDLIRSASLNTENHTLTLKVEEGFAPQEDEMILINRTSADLPNGYVGKVKSISGESVVLEPVTDITEVFEELSIGDPLWSTGGDAVPSGGYAIDLTRYITSIERPDGQPVEYAIAGSSISMEVPITRAEAEVDTKFSMPALGHTFKIDDGSNNNNSCALKLGVQMDLALYFHILIQGWSLKDLHCRVNPTVNLSSGFTIDWVSDSNVFGTEIPFIIIRTAPIPAGPVMIIPLIEFFLTFDLEGKAGLAAELSYSKEFSFGMAYRNGELSNYSQVEQKEGDSSPLAFTPKVQLEGSFAAGIAPKVGFSLWEIIRLDTRVYTKVKSGANLNFDLAAPAFDPSLYNAFSGSKLFSQLELFMKGGVFGWRNREFATTESNTLEYPIWEAYFVPKMENFSVTAEGGMMEIALDISNKLFFDSEIGMNIYEKDEKSGKFTVEAGKMKLCEYSRPPAGKNKYALRMEESTSLPPGKEYEACLTVSLDAPGGPYTLETDVRTRFIPQDASMTLTTSKMVGSKIRLGMASKYVSSTGDERFKVWIDLNNNGKEDENENVTPDYSFVEYTIQSQTITIHGPVSDFTCSDNQITSLDISRNAGLGSLSCGDNLLTSLDVSNNTSLETLYCTGNLLTSLEVSNNMMLTALGCYNNRLTKLDVNGATALTSLTCHENLLTTLDISSLSELDFFRCDNNQLTSLNVSNNNLLKDFRCNNNRIDTLDVSKNRDIFRLNCHENQLEKLDVSMLPKLKELTCGKNQLKELILNNPALTSLSCENNQLVSFNITPSTVLAYLYCPRNNLTTLDISNNTALTYLYCSFNQLTTLDASSNVSLPSLSCSFNQLVSLVVSDQGVIKTVNCESNRLRGTAITELIESLPDRTGMNYGSVDFGFSFLGGVPGENYYTGSDKEEARKKHWLFY
jgi:hypothetical protein